MNWLKQSYCFYMWVWCVISACIVESFTLTPAMSKITSKTLIRSLKVDQEIVGVANLAALRGGQAILKGSSSINLQQGKMD